MGVCFCDRGGWGWGQAEVQQTREGDDRKVIMICGRKELPGVEVLGSIPNPVPLEWVLKYIIGCSGEF